MHLLAGPVVAEMPRPFVWTRDAYHRAADTGIFDGQRVELIGGEIIIMAPQRDLHAHAIRLIDYALRAVFRTGYVVVIQSPLNLGATSEPEPDLAVVRGSPRSVRKHPRTAELVVEVADTTLAFDLDAKASLYASARIADYWVADLVNGQLHVLRDPARQRNTPFGHAYRSVTVLQPGDAVSPLAASRSKMPVADLLP